MRHEFPYIEKDGRYFPVVEITLNHQEKEITVKALVDSGASFSVFSPEIAEYLGIKLAKGKKVYLTGIGGRILGYIHSVALTLGNKTFPCKIVFSPEFKVSFNLLGRDNFFTPFVISFIEKRKKVVVADVI
ncbi:MAG: retropepsin-like aspartic protease [bacterium]|nr:retropepsin-like aspartic protease [bacterium]